MTLLESVTHLAPGGITLRPERDADRDFVDRLYAATRANELAQVPWPAEAVADFLRQQSALQRAHYRQHYAGALLLILEDQGTPVGRLYLYEMPGEVRLMDIALLPGSQRRGIGTALITAILGYARQAEARATLHVEPDNPVNRLYARLGFRLVERRGVYDFLEWTGLRALDALRADDFEPLRGQGFVLRMPGGESLPIVLAAVSRRPPAAPSGREGFSLTFESDSAAAHPQSIYRIEQPALGAMDLFLVPIGPGPSGMRYEAVFG